MEKKWEEMTADEKRNDLVAKWLSPAGVKFNSPDAEKAYKARVTRIMDAVNLKKPDRVPVFPMTGFFPAYYAGFTPRDVMYDYDKLMSSFKKYVLDMQPDAHGSVTVSPPGKTHDILDYKLYAWPGHGVAPEHSYQCIEGEYMKADEYDALIDDPTYFFMTTFLPRTMAALDGLKMLSPFTNMTEMYGGFTGAALVPFGLPPVQAALKALMDAGSEALKWIGTVAVYGAEMAAGRVPWILRRREQSSFRHHRRYAQGHAGDNAGYVPAAEQATPCGGATDADNGKNGRGQCQVKWQPDSIYPPA